MGTETERPDATTNNTFAVTGGGGDVDLVLSDNSDLTYLSDDSVGENLLVGLSEPTIPPGALVKAYKVRLRVQRSSGASQPMVSGYLRGEVGGVTWVYGWAAVLVSNTTVATLTFLNFDTNDELVGVPMTQPANFRLEVTMTTNIAGGFRIYEAYADAIYVAKPVVAVTAVTPDPLLTDNSPTIAWVNTLDADGGVQTKYQLKIFDTATYSGGSFDPSTSTPDYNSGVVSSNELSATVGVALVDDTYRAYVRVAQDVNGVDHWSDWAFDQFQVNVTEPPTPTLTATADNANGRIELVVTEDNTTAGSAPTFYEIERSVDAGVTWEPVRTFEPDGKIVAAEVIGSTTFNDSADGTSHVVNIPQPYDGSGIQAGDLLMAFAGHDGNPSYTWPSGWVELSDAAGNGSAVRNGAAYFRCAGGEVGTFTITTSASEGGGVVVLLIRGAHPTTAPEIGTNPTGASAGPDPGSLNPAGWDTEDTLWLAEAVWDNGAGTVVMNANPTNWDDPVGTTVLTAVWANVAGAGVAVAQRREKVASIDPGAFTLSASEDWSARTFAVRPASEANMTLYDYEAPNGVTVQYRVRSAHLFSSGTVARSPWSSPVDSAFWTGTSYWLKVPEDPSLNTTHTLASFQGHNHAARAGVFQALGAPPGDAVAVVDTPDPEAGSLRIRADSQAERNALEAIYVAGRVVLFQDISGGNVSDRYMTLTSHSSERIVDASWMDRSWEAFDWVEVASPGGELE